jgi:prefoldin subunit 2
LTDWRFGDLQLIEDRETLANSVIEREQEAEEHALVIMNLEKQDGSKKAWRLIGEVLVERTVQEVLPELIKQRDNLLAMANSLKRQLESKQTEVLDFQEKYKIRIKGSKEESNESSKSQKQQSQGVLV